MLIMQYLLCLFSRIILRFYTRQLDKSIPVILLSLSFDLFFLRLVFRFAKTFLAKIPAKFANNLKGGFVQSGLVSLIFLVIDTD